MPGIGYVIDTGTARISRYSQRTKVQRLPIEAISQASANQRAGRCGRLADGIGTPLDARSMAPPRLAVITQTNQMHGLVSGRFAPVNKQLPGISGNC